MMVITILIFSSCTWQSLGSDGTYLDLYDGFNDLPDSTKPWVYWYWISDHISRDGITRDLETMDSIGVGAALIGNVYLSNIERGKVPALSEAWYEHLRFAMQEGARLGIDIGIFNGPGWVQSGGPWIDSTEAMHYLVCRDTIVEEGFSLEASTLNIRHGQPVALFAYPVRSLKDFPQPAEVHSSLSEVTPGQLFDKNLNSEVLFPENEMAPEDIWIEFSFNQVVTARSIQLVPIEQPFYMEFDLEIWEGNKYHHVCSGRIDRSNKMLTVGPATYGPVVKNFPQVSGNKWRIRFTQLNKNKVWFTDVKRIGGLKEIILSDQGMLENYIEKQLGKMHQLPSPEWQAYQWTEQVDYGDTSSQLSKDSWIDLTYLSNMDSGSWITPDGFWHIYSFSMLPTGVTNAPVSPESQGLDVDKMQKEYVFGHFDHYIKPLLDRLTEEEKKALKYLIIDSYETGSQNWTDGLRERFKVKYGYDPLPWLPVINGDIVGSADLSDRFLWDLRRLVADEISDQYVSGLHEKAQENQMKLWVENYGHWGFPGEFLQYGGRADLVGGEFWMDDPLGEIECRAAASAGHIYGKEPIYAEAFTAPRKHFSRYPGMLRKRGDWSYAQGINHHVLHVYIHQPYQDTFPGINTWFGVEFNRQNIWFPKSKSWINYLRRNHFLLQQGNYQADVCYFIGEGAPQMTGIKDPELPRGYSYDFINAEVIINDMQVENHRLVLPNGMSYAVLVLPPLKTMRPEFIKKIERMVLDGAHIVGNAPERSPSLQNYPTCDSVVSAIAEKMWGTDTLQKSEVEYGAGMIFKRDQLEPVLAELKIEPDLMLNGTDADSVLWIHRQIKGVDIYFLTNQSDQLLNIMADFRIEGKYPEIWDAVTGEQNPVVSFIAKNNRTQIPLEFQPAESYYLIFSNNNSTSGRKKNYLLFEEVQNLSGDWKIQFDHKLRGPGNPFLTNELFDWSKSAYDSIKYFSGTATYEKSFEFTGDTLGNYFLDLKGVSWLANIYLNGKEVGGAWTEEARVRLDNIRLGTNDLKIDLTNTWVNRLVGDSDLPQEKRLTWIAENPFRVDTPLQRSGLLGPVKIVRGIK